MPICKSCLQDKKQSEFYKHSQMPSGYLNFCKECKKQYARVNRSKEKDKLRYWSSPKRRLYVIYRGIMSRCYDKNNSHYPRYGGRGIKVLWNNYKEFYSDMSASYIEHWENNGAINSRGTQIDRINNDGHYCKENCLWVCPIKQNNNKSSNVLFEHNGITDTLANICRKNKADYKKVHLRLSRGRTLEKALI